MNKSICIYWLHALDQFNIILEWVLFMQLIFFLSFMFHALPFLDEFRHCTLQHTQSILLG